MEVKTLGCYGGAAKQMELTSFMLSDDFVIDAGAIHTSLTVEEQIKIRNIIISHVHMDHIIGLPFFLDAVYGKLDTPLNIYALPETIDHLRKNLFNDVLWPDFSKLPSVENPTVRFVEVENEKVFTINDMEILPVKVDHIVPTIGMLVKEANGNVWLYSSDTANTDRIWQVANEYGNLKLVFIECSFPNRHQGLADSSKHLTPNGVIAQLEKLDGDPPVRTYHYKPSYIEEIRKELEEIDYPDLRLLEQGEVHKI